MADKKRKGLMAVLSEYQTEKGYGAKTKGKGPVKSSKEYGKTLKKNKKEDASGPKVMAPKKPVAKKTTSKPKVTAKPKTAGKAGSSTKAQPPKAPASVQKGNGDGTYGKSMPSNPQYKNVTMAPRKKRPGTGRTGEAAAKAANRSSAPKKKPMTAAERRKMRLRARRGR
jgi:hypothetical protein